MGHLMDFFAQSRNSTISMWKERAKKGCSLCGRMRHLKPRSAASSAILRHRFHVETPAFQRVRNVIKGKVVLAASTRSSMSYEVNDDFRRPSDVFALQCRFVL